MQKTNFKFEAIVHDDCSTDGSIEIIKEYAAKYPDIIKPIFEIENQYSKHDGSLEAIVNAHLKGKYIAVCEGDDYWIDPLKLQKQVDFMENHPFHSLCFTAHQTLLNNQFSAVRRYRSDIIDCPTKDLIEGGGGFMATGTMLFRKNVYDAFPDWASSAPVGDWPLVLVCATLGRVSYLDSVTTVYRMNSNGSWTNKFNFDYHYRLHFTNDLISMLKLFNLWSGRQYNSSVRRMIIKLSKDYPRIFFHLLLSYINKVFI